jgi:hypothetical protein
VVLADRNAVESDLAAAQDETSPYTLTTAGRKRFAVECDEFDQIVLAIRKVLSAT